MAKTFTLTSSKYDGRYMKLTCTQTSNGSSANSSTIKWTLETIGGSSSYYSTGPTKVTINGTQVYSKDRVGWSSKVFPAKAGSTSGEITVNHNNDGTKSVAVSFSTAIHTSTVSTYSDTWTLDSIPRYPTVTQYNTSKTETSITMSWSSDKLIDYLWYSTNGGTNWTGVDITDAKSGTYTINNLSANTTYKVMTRVRSKDSQLWTNSLVTQVTTYDYPYCTDTPDFMIGDELTIKLYNPLSRQVTVSFIGANGESLSTDTTAQDFVTGYNTESFKTKLYNSIPNDTIGRYKIKVTYGSSERTRDNDNTYIINRDECYPTFTNFTYKDTNTTVTGVTGNNQVLVKGLSTLQVTISTANKMTTQKGATPSKYIATIDGVSKTVLETDSDINVDMGAVNSSGSKRLSVKAFDSRRVNVEAYKDITVLDYTKPVVNVNVARLNNFESQTSLKVDGTYNKLTVNGTDKNSILSVVYRYREVNGTWSDPVTLKTTVTSGKFNCNEVTINLDNTKAFEIEVTVTDKLDSNTGSGTLDIGEAIFFISSNKKACYVNGVDIMADASYSTNEVEVGTWVDGRPLYKKTIQVNALENTGLSKVTHNISDLDFIININGMATNGTNFLPLPYLTEATTTNINIYANATELRISTGNDRSTYKAYVTITYVKVVS